MPITNISLGRLQTVHPELARRIQTMIDALDTEGFNIQVSQALRTWTEQDALYAQGRTVPGKIVTDARGGWSAHNFGYAVDLDPVDFKGQADWNENHPVWKRMLAVGLSCGLAEGASWRAFPDEPHFYLNEFPADPTQAMRDAFASGGISKVWEIFLPAS